MIHRFHWLKGGAAVLVVAAATITPTTGSAATAVYVADVEELYAAVNNYPANVGASVILAPGIYLLSSTDSLGNGRPNGGLLELLEDMSLYGVVGDRAAVVIDATALPQSSFTTPFGRTGVIRTGRGRNAVEWLTIAGNPFAAASVETDSLPLAPQAQVRVAHVVAGNSARGVDIRNVGAATIGHRLDAEIVDGEFFGSVEGIRVASFVGADDGDIRVVMSGNRVHDNRLGCIFEHNRSSRATIYVRSSGDRFEGNGLGCQVGGGIVTMATGFANSNSTVFEGDRTEFINNNKRSDFCTKCGGPLFDDFGGVVVSAGDTVVLDHATSSNTVTVRLWGCKVAENTAGSGIDFQAFGARSGASSGETAGTANQTTIELLGVSAQVAKDVVRVYDNAPNPSPSNTVTIFPPASAP